MERDIRFDHVRTIAIIGIVTLHVYGGVTGIHLGIGNRLVADLILSIASCSVNLFGLLSGYLKIDKKQHYTSLLRVITATLFWCIVCAFVGVLVFDQSGLRVFMQNAFPFLVDRMWYISCYIFVFICSPYLNHVATSISKENYRKLLISLTFLMSLVPTVFMIDCFHVAGHGYSAGWLIYLYLWGGVYKALWR